MGGERVFSRRKLAALRPPSLLVSSLRHQVLEKAQILISILPGPMPQLQTPGQGTHLVVSIKWGKNICLLATKLYQIRLEINELQQSKSAPKMIKRFHQTEHRRGYWQFSHVSTDAVDIGLVQQTGNPRLYLTAPKGLKAFLSQYSKCKLGGST